MAVQKIKNALIYCLAADTKPATYADNTLAYEVDTGSVYKSTSGVWSIISGASKTETFTNKTIDYPTNTVKGLIQYARNKRFSYSYITNTTIGWIGFMGGLGLLGTANHAIDATGIYCNLTTGTVSGTRVGRASNSAETPCSRASYLPQLFAKFGCSSSTLTRMFFGFSSATTIPAANTPLATSDSGVIFGWDAGDTNMQIFNNDGSAAAVKTAYTPTTAVDTAVHTVSMVWNNATSVTVQLDALASVTVTTRLPAATTNLIPYCCMSNNSAVSQTLALYYIDGEQNL